MAWEWYCTQCHSAIEETEGTVTAQGYEDRCPFCNSNKLMPIEDAMKIFMDKWKETFRP